jgi:cysteine desulfurase
MAMTKKNIYLDHAATTPLDDLVLKKMSPYFKKDYGNAASSHFFGQKANLAVEEARKKISQTLKIEPDEVIFTGSATESNNLTIKGVYRGVIESVDFKNSKAKKLHFISTNIEHHCVLDSMEALNKEYSQSIEIDFIKVNKKGLVEINKLKNLIKDNTVLVSIGYVNNEIGTLQPIQKIGELIKKIKAKRQKEDNPLPIYFYSDAVQAFQYYDCDMQKLNLDLLTLSAHKIYGPKGVGLLAKQRKVKLKPIIHGGGQEFNLRSGTLNVPGIVGIGEAVNLANKNRKKNYDKIIKLRDYFIEKILKEIPETKLNGSKKFRSPNNINISFKGIEGESLLLMLDNEGIAVSTGSACSSSSLSASHVQLAINNSHLQAHSSIRFTLGKDNTKQDLNYTVKALVKITKNLRKISKGIKI